MSNLPQIEILPQTDDQGRTLYRLIEDYEYQVGPGCKITVPAGYVTNGASVPRAFYRFLAPSELKQASIVHDWLCNERFGPHPHVDSGYSRWFSDAMLYESMRKMGFNIVTRTAVFLAVRAWAWWSGRK